MAEHHADEPTFREGIIAQRIGCGNGILSMILASRAAEVC